MRSGPHYKFNVEQENWIVDMYSQGYTSAALAIELKVATETVRSFLKRKGIQLRGRAAPKKFIDSVQFQKIVDAYESGSSTEELAAGCGMSAGGLAMRLKKAGVTLRSSGFQIGEDHHNWKGGCIPTSDGKYMQVLVYPDDPFYSMAKVKSPNSNGGRYVLEHRYKMAKKLGRCLTDTETVHHKDDNGLNNNLKNLQLRHGKHGKGASFRCCDCGSYNVEAQALVG